MKNYFTLLVSMLSLSTLFPAIDEPTQNNTYELADTRDEKQLQEEMERRKEDIRRKYAKLREDRRFLGQPGFLPDKQLSPLMLSNRSSTSSK